MQLNPKEFRKMEKGTKNAWERNKQEDYRIKLEM